MTRTVLDPRVWLPALVGALAFAPRALPKASPPPTPQARASELPALASPRRDDKPRAWRLDEDGSTVRFLVHDGEEHLLVACPQVAGSLTRDPAGAGTLELRIDLAAAAPLRGTPGLDLHHVLGVRRADVIAYRGTLVSAATTDLPGVERVLFVGQLAFGDRVLQQPMQLWMTRIPGRPARLQGHGPVRTDAYDLPQRGWLGLDSGPLQVTLGLDLEWRLDAR
jgi:hypothetical protein